MVVIPTDTGIRPEILTKTKIVLRDWTRRFAFWTLDLSGIRHIFRSFPGTPKGVRQCKRWTGSDMGEDNEW